MIDYNLYNHYHDWHYNSEYNDSYCPNCGYWKSVVDTLKKLDKDEV